MISAVRSRFCKSYFFPFFLVMQKVALPVIFISAVAAALFYVSQEEHGAGTLVLLASVLLVGQICATLPYIFEAKKPRGNANAGETPGAQRIVANQQVIHEDLRSLGDALIKRLNALSERQDALEKKLLAEISKDVPAITDELGETLGKIDEKLDERFENFSNALNERLAGFAPKPDFSEKLDRIAERLDEFGDIIENLTVVEVEDDGEEDVSEGESTEEISEAEEVPAEPSASDSESEDLDDEEDIVVEEDWADEDAEISVSAESDVPEEEELADDFPEDLDLAPESVEEIPEEHVEQGELALGDMPPAKGATLVLDAMLGIENKPFLRGNAPGLSEDSGKAMTFVEIGRWSYDFAPLTEEVSVRILRNDDENDPLGDAVTIAPGQTLELDYVP